MSRCDHPTSRRECGRHLRSAHPSRRASIVRLAGDSATSVVAFAVSEFTLLALYGWNVTGATAARGLGESCRHGPFVPDESLLDLERGTAGPCRSPGCDVLDHIDSLHRRDEPGNRRHSQVGALWTSLPPRRCRSRISLGEHRVLVGQIRGLPKDHLPGERTGSTYAGGNGSRDRLLIGTCTSAPDATVRGKNRVGECTRSEIGDDLEV